MSTPLFTPAPGASRVIDHSARPLSITPPPGTVSLALGEPDFPTPQPIVAAMEQALRDGYTRYADWNGDPQLREVIAAQASGVSSATYGPENVVVTHGSTAAIVVTALSMVGPGERVVIPEPTYSLYADAVRFAGGEPVHVPLRMDHHLDLERIAAAARGARLIVLCTPGNPTGAVLTAAELAAVADIAADTGAWVLADEAYCELVYAPSVFTPAVSVPSLTERLIVCQTLSKTYAMTGWRIGYVLAPTPVAETMRVVHRTINGSVNAAVQRAAIVALTQGPDLAAPMLAEYARRREYVVGRIAQMSGLEATEPEGAFYAFTRYRHDIGSVEMAARLLEAGVAVRPGAEFGPTGEGRIRISFSVSRDDLAVGLDRIEQVLGSLAADSG